MTRIYRMVGLGTVAVLATAAAWACGGGGDGADDEYVADFCNSQREFSTTLEAAIRNSSTTSSFDEIAAPFATLAKNFKDMDPPDDLKDWHREVASQLDSTAKKVAADKNLSAVTSLPRDPLTGMPQEPRLRLRRIANDEPACNGLNVFEG